MGQPLHHLVQFRLRPSPPCDTPYINRGRIETSFYVRGVELIDHLDTGSAVFGDMMDIPSLHQAAADVGVAMAASGQQRTQTRAPIYVRFWVLSGRNQAKSGHRQGRSGLPSG